ncbi:MAG: NAD-dependent epimerase/dehydratase family protein [Marmoricola sp.]
MGESEGPARVFVTGATGVLGRWAVPALLAAGHRVTGLARSPEKARTLAGLGADPVEVSLFDAAALTEAFRDHDAVCNLATAIPSLATYGLSRSWRANARIRREGSTAVTDAALAAGVPRLVQESIVMTYPDLGDEWIDETTPLDVYPIVESSPVAEGNVERFSDAGGAGLVLRFGLFYGPGTSMGSMMAGMARRRVGIQLGTPTGYLSSVHVADAGSAVVAALHAPAGVYNVVDDQPLTRREYADAVSAAVRQHPAVRLPGRLALLGGRNFAAVTRSIRASNRRLRDTTGWAPRYPSAREGYVAG